MEKVEKFKVGDAVVMFSPLEDEDGNISPNDVIVSVGKITRVGGININSKEVEYETTFGIAHEQSLCTEDEAISFFERNVIGILKLQ